MRAAGGTQPTVGTSRRTGNAGTGPGAGPTPGVQRESGPSASGRACSEGSRRPAAGSELEAASDAAPLTPSARRSRRWKRATARGVLRSFCIWATRTPRSSSDNASPDDTPLVPPGGDSLSTSWLNLTVVLPCGGDECERAGVRRLWGLPGPRLLSSSAGGATGRVATISRSCTSYVPST